MTVVVPRCVAGDQEEEGPQGRGAAEQQAEGDDPGPGGEGIRHTQEAPRGMSPGPNYSLHIVSVVPCSDPLSGPAPLAGHGAPVCRGPTGRRAEGGPPSDRVAAAQRPPGPDAPPAVPTGLSPRQTGLPGHRGLPHAQTHAPTRYCTWPIYNSAVVFIIG